jgi:Uma2 family endonuclease
MIITEEDLSALIPADWVPGPAQGFWTYEDYATLPNDGRRYEIVNGVLLMAPAPNPEHQGIVALLMHYLVVQIQFAGLGRVLPGPVDVVLGPKNVYQPDAVVILNEHMERVQEKSIVGAPDLVVEIASPSTAMFDRVVKYEMYARAGIAEYWIVKQKIRSVEVMVLEHGEYSSLGVFSGQAMLPSRIVPGLSVKVEQFFM